MSSSVSQLLSKYNYLLNHEKTYAETETRLDFISFIWEDYHIMRLDENIWQCLWCNTMFQIINATKSISHILGKKGIYIKSCYVPKDKAHIKIYQGPQKYKQAQKVALHEYPEKIKASI